MSSGLAEDETVLEALQRMRCLYPEGTLYVVMDNLRTHKTEEVSKWCAAHEWSGSSVRLVPQPDSLMRSPKTSTASSTPSRMSASDSSS